MKIFNGNKMETKSTLMKHFAKKLSLPEYFGANWDALEEVLNDFEELEISFKHQERILYREPEQLNTWNQIIESCKKNKSIIVK